MYHDTRCLPRVVAVKTLSEHDGRVGSVSHVHGQVAGLRAPDVEAEDETGRAAKRDLRADESET